MVWQSLSNAPCRWSERIGRRYSLLQPDRSDADSVPAAAFGVLLGTVGMNTAGFIRGTMGVPELLDGVSPVPAMIGLLAAGQLLTLAGKEGCTVGEGRES
jgi:TctA family transporter